MDRVDTLLVFPAIIYQPPLPRMEEIYLKQLKRFGIFNFTEEIASITLTTSPMKIFPNSAKVESTKVRPY